MSPPPSPADQPPLPSDEVLQRPSDETPPLQRRMNLLVTGMGVASTAVTLVLVELMRGAGADPMLYFADYVIPIGSIGVGLVAGLGYGVGSWLTQARLSRRALTLMAALHAVAWSLLYVTAWWRLHPGHGGGIAGFFQWFDAATRQMAWKDDHGRIGEPLGLLGYLVRLGEVAGFIAGGLIAPLVLYAKPYCESCQRYFKQRLLFSLPAAAEHRSFVRQKTLDTADAPVRERLDADLQVLGAAFASGDGKQVDAAITGVASRTAANRKVRSWLRVFRHRCPGCGVGFIDLMAQNGSNSKRLQRLPVKAEALDAADDVAARLPELRRRAAEEQRAAAGAESR